MSTVLYNCSNFWCHKSISSQSNCIILSCSSSLSLITLSHYCESECSVTALHRSSAAAEKSQQLHSSYHMSNSQGSWKEQALRCVMCQREPAKSFVTPLRLTQCHAFTHGGWGYVIQLLLRVEDEPNYKMIYGASIRHRAENPSGKSTHYALL